MPTLKWTSMIKVTVSVMIMVIEVVELRPYNGKELSKILLKQWSPS